MNRVRFGIRTNSWIFPNAAVFVLKLNNSQWVKLEGLVNQLKGALPADIASKIVCEVS